MNGNGIFKKAYLMLGFDNENEITLSNQNNERNLEFINQIAKDLKLSPIEELSSEVIWKDNEAQAVISGVTMLLCLTEGEADKSQWFTSVYNSKRSALLCKTVLIEDNLPTAESGDV